MNDAFGFQLSVKCLDPANVNATAGVLRDAFVGTCPKMNLNRVTLNNFINASFSRETGAAILCSSAGTRIIAVLEARAKLLAKVMN
jgi:hypothetical protein